MTNYFEETDQMDIYNSLTDYQKGVLDGFLEIANMVEDEIADFAEDELAEYMEDFIVESDKNELGSCTSAEESSEILAKEAYITPLAVALRIIIPYRRQKVNRQEKKKPSSLRASLSQL